MAIAYQGVTKIDCSAGNVSGSQTIPASATFGVAQMSYYDGGVTGVSSLTVDGQTATEVIDVGPDTGNFYPGTYLSIVSGFTTGSKTIALNWSSDQAIDEGGVVYITWWSGADTSALSDSDSDRNADTTAVSTSVTTAANEVVVAHTQKFDGGTGVEMTVDGSPTITSVYDDDVTNSEEVDLDYFTRTQTTHALDVTNEGYSSQIVAVIAEDSGSEDTLLADDIESASEVSSPVLAQPPNITDVNTTESWTDGDTGIVATGTGFS